MGLREWSKALRTQEGQFKKYAGVLGTFPRGKQDINEWMREMRDE
jgi:hypothetical protein